MSADVILLILLGSLHLTWLMDPSLRVFYSLGANPYVAPILTTITLGYAWLGTACKSSSRTARLGKTVLIVCLVSLFAIVPLIQNVQLRQENGPATYSHDGLIQTELATAFFAQGRNPYVVSYRDTPMADWTFREGDLTENPALDHVPYLPATFILPWPLRQLSMLALGWYDQRLFHLIAFVVAWFAAHRLLGSQRWLQFTIVLALSPLLLPYFLEGRNDVVILAWLLLATVALRQNHTLQAAAFFALACATKQTAWFFFPALALYRYSRTSSRASLARDLAVFAGILALFLLPFLVWAPAAFVGDTLSYQSGRGAHPYPVKGLGLSQLMLMLGLLPSTSAPFPFWIPQAILGGAALAWVLRFVHRHPSLKRVWIGSGLLLAVVGFASRAFNDSHWGFAGLVLVVGYLLGEGSPSVQANG